MSKQVKCPLCNGEKGSICHHNTGLDSSRHYWGWVDCLTCKGTGTVDMQTLSNIEIGKKLRLARLHAGLSLIDAAKEYGVSPATISGIENRGRHHSEASGYLEILNETPGQRLKECPPVSLGAAFDLRRIARRPVMKTHKCSKADVCKSTACSHAIPHEPKDCTGPAPCGAWPGNPDFKPMVICLSAQEAGDESTHS